MLNITLDKANGQILVIITSTIETMYNKKKFHLPPAHRFKNALSLKQNENNREF